MNAGVRRARVSDIAQGFSFKGATTSLIFNGSPNLHLRVTNIPPAHAKWALTSAELAVAAENLAQAHNLQVIFNQQRSVLH